MILPDFDSDASRARTNKAIWSLVAVMLIAVGLSYPAAGLSIDPSGGWSFLLTIPACLCAAIYYRRYRPDPWISIGSEAAAQLIAILLLGTLLSYAAATMTYSYRDAELYAVDRWLGFDWRAYLHFYDRHPTLGHIGHLAYFSMKLQVPVVVLVLTASGRFVRLQQFVLVTGLTLILTLLVYAFVPAVGNYAYLGIAPSEFANLTPSCATDHIRHLQGMRDGTSSIVKLNDLEGVIIFPSFHAVSAIVFTWIMWPVRKLRWTFVALNLVMLAATPIDGAHYAIDLIGGGIIAVIAIAIVERMFPRSTVAAQNHKPEASFELSNSSRIPTGN